MSTQELTKEAMFIDRLEKLDAGGLAALRRGCGERDPVEGRCPWLHALIFGVSTEATAFLVASLLAQYKTAVIRSGGHRFEGNFGRTWRRAIAGKDSQSLERRFHILLDADFDPSSGDGALRYRLRQVLRYAAAQGVGVDWPLLLKHLRAWNEPSKWPQKEWARGFYEGETESDEPESDAPSMEKE